MKACIIGRSGFIGKALSKRFKEVTSVPTRDCDVIIDFGSPVHPPFEQNPDYYFKTLIDRHLYFLSFGVYYVYPSSALVYENRDLAFIHFKRALEEIAKAYPNNLGLRIFPVYGPGENRTVIAKICKAIKQGESPEIYGDGRQTRNFVYIDDLADEIEILVNTEAKGILDIATDEQISFNQVVRTVNTILKTNVEPVYIPAPEGYYLESPACHEPLVKYTNLYDGCKAVLEQTV